MKLNQIDILPDGRIVLVLHDGGLPHGMSTHEAKLYAHDKFFGALLDELSNAATAMPSVWIETIYNTQNFLEVQG
jgi:hypothetical protein